MAKPSAATRLVLLFFVLVLSSVAGACASEDDGALAVPEAGDVEVDYEFVILPGSTDRIMDGEDVSILPAELDVRVGEVIRIINNDSAGHSVGIFYIGAGEVMTQRFASPGEYIGGCTARLSGTFTLTVRN